MNKQITIFGVTNLHILLRVSWEMWQCHAVDFYRDQWSVYM